MPRSSLSSDAWLLAAIIGLFTCHHAQAQTKPSPAIQTASGAVVDKQGTVIEVANHEAAVEAELRKSLQTPVDANFKDAPLNKVIQRIATTIGHNILLDEQALREESVQPDVPVTHQGKPIAAARLLDRILPPLGLTWIVHDHVVKVTTFIAAEEIHVTRAYSVGDLIEYAKTHRREDVASHVAPELQFVQFGGWENDLSPCGPDPDTSPEGWLLDLLQRMTKGDCWDDFEGSHGSMSYLNNTIVIRETHRIQDQCEKILQTVRQFTTGRYPEGTIEIRPLHYSHEEDVAVKEALRKVISIKCEEVPLQNLLDTLSDKVSVPIHVDQQALKEEGVSIDEDVSVELKNIPSSSALKLVLEPLGCCALVEDGRILVTTIIGAEEHLYARFYDIRDLDDAGYDGSNLLDVLQQETPGSWLTLANFGHSPMIPLNGLLAVWQTQGVHNDIEALLADLRNQIASHPATQKQKSQPDAQEVTTRFYNLETVPDSADVPKAILLLIEPDSWAINKNDSSGQVINVGHVLVVKNRIEVQAKVKKFLEDLQNATGSQ